jgi:hypothetical protein
MKAGNSILVSNFVARSWRMTYGTSRIVDCCEYGVQSNLPMDKNHGLELHVSCALVTCVLVHRMPAASLTNWGQIDIQSQTYACATS